ncbi:hypothetical protein HanIR_Chr04g0207721 [Helianthus annuus]|nr:hypothetical protein HanIR_Chr04g0207721 [Helianthus annuus]
MCQYILCRLHSNHFSNSFSKMSTMRNWLGAQGVTRESCKF